ncbi:hypothetical protein [Vibrio ouci]|uniref:Uncharacterized protein n=1 Tax=Vibrio ouci TaxID=2499078 RepID=A0A4Y8WIV4_9VIBR|nr:hypothetical protein [Vibrio ouci]TFH92586.1 hypothetical protein ELS82_05180 [Vibrio ouci]
MNRKAISIISKLGLVVLLSGCGGGDGDTAGTSGGESSAGNEPSGSQTPAASSPPALTQPQVEAMASSSLSSASVDDGFSFQTQQHLAVSITFDAPQTDTQIFLFSVDDRELLIEDVTLSEGLNYRTKITVPQTTEAIKIRIDGTREVTLPISGLSAITYHVTS